MRVTRADSELVQYVEGAVPDVLATIRDTGELPPEQATLLDTNIRVFVALQVAQQWNADAEILYLETDSEYSYRL